MTTRNRGLLVHRLRGFPSLLPRMIRLILHNMTLPTWVRGEFLQRLTVNVGRCSVNILPGEQIGRLSAARRYRVIKRLMDATFAAQNQDLKILLAGLEYEARLRKQEIEGRLGVRN